MILANDIRVLQIGSQVIYHDNGVLPRMIFDPDAIVGWDDTADIKRDSASRPISHGDFSSRAFFEGKIITITGHAVANNPKELHLMRDKMAGLLQTGEEQWVSVSNGSGTRHMRVSQGSKLSWVQVLDGYAKWKLDLYAADPRMYSNIKTTQVYSSTLDTQGLNYGPNNTAIQYPLDFGVPTKVTSPTLDNDGNSEAWPIFTVYGDLPNGFSLTNGQGKIITYTGTMFDSMPVKIDTFRGSATIGGVDRSYLLSRRDWFSIPAYGGITPRFTPTIESSAWADVEWRDTWV